jgi:hypothetical protein
MLFDKGISIGLVRDWPIAELLHERVIGDDSLDLFFRQALSPLPRAALAAISGFKVPGASSREASWLPCCS